MKVVFAKSEPVADNIRTFYFTPADGQDYKPHYTAGQFIELRVPHNNRDNRGDKRWFTLSSAPSEPFLTITTKFAPQDGSTFKAALLNLKPGAELDMAAPMGDFVLPKDSSIPLVFVAGGIGATPFRSMIKACQDSGEQRDITLLYGAHSHGEVAFSEIFKPLGKHFIPVVGKSLSAKLILSLAEPADNAYIYLSGPEAMIEALQKDLRQAGVDRRHIQTDFFVNYD